MVSIVSKSGKVRAVNLMINSEEPERMSCEKVEIQSLCCQTWDVLHRGLEIYPTKGTIKQRLEWFELFASHAETNMKKRNPYPIVGCFNCNFASIHRNQLKELELYYGADFLTDHWQYISEKISDGERLNEKILPQEVKETVSDSGRIVTRTKNVKVEFEFASIISGNQIVWEPCKVSFRYKHYVAYFHSLNRADNIITLTLRGKFPPEITPQPIPLNVTKETILQRRRSNNE